MLLNRPKQRYGLFLVLLICVYAAIYGWLLISTNFLPYVMDNNESFSSLWHAANLYHFGLVNGFGLTDEAYGPHPEAHPYVHTHQGNFPRLFAFVLYVLGARRVESQILITTFSVGLAAILFAYHYFSKVSGVLFAFIACVVLISDYIFIAQWQVVTYRVWHGFFVFSTLLCAHGIGEGRRRLWAALTFINYLCLFYFEYIFVLFLAIFAGLYTGCLYYRSPRGVLKAWAVQAAGALVSVLVLVGQVATYLGWSALARDIYFTYTARNVASDGPKLLARLHQFYDGHNIVFWYNLMDSGHLRTFRSLVKSLFTWQFQIYTPLFTLIVLTLVGGWLLGLPGWRPERRVDTAKHPAERLRTAFRLVTSYVSVRLLASISIRSPFRRLSSAHLIHAIQILLRALPLGLSCFFVLIAILSDGAFLGVPHLPLWYGGWRVAAVAMLGAIGTSLALAKAVTGRWRGFADLSLARVGIASVYLCGVAYFIRKQFKLYDQGFQPLWLEQLEGWLPNELNMVTVMAAAGLALVLAMLGTRRILGNSEDCVSAMVRYLGCGFIAFGIVYALSPGYVFTGYFYRSAPLAVFLTDVLVAVAMYVVLVVGIKAVRRFPAHWQAFHSWARTASVRHPGWGTMPAETTFFAAGAGSLAMAILGGGLLLFTAGYWINLQATYVTLLPPTHFSFLKTLAKPPYRGASFVVNTYAAPVAAYTGQWAYFDPVISTGNIQLTDDGYAVDRDTESYLWLADKRDNPAYRRPDYYACMIPQSFPTVLGRLQNRSQDFGICSGIGIVQRVLSEDREVLRHRFIAMDTTDHDSWAILKLDWDYPPYLRPLDVSNSGSRVQAVLTRAPNGIAVRARYSYAHQEGKAESGSLLRLYRVGKDGPERLIQEVTTPKRLFLPAEFKGTVRVSVVPRTPTKAGLEYFSEVVQVTASAAVYR